MLHQLYVPYSSSGVCEVLNMNPYTPVVSLLTTLVRLFITLEDGGYHPKSTPVKFAMDPSEAEGSPFGGFEEENRKVGVRSESEPIWPRAMDRARMAPTTKALSSNFAVEDRSLTSEHIHSYR